MNESSKAAFSGTRVLVTGGLGFIGSSLCMRLIDLGAEVTILDAMLEGHGGNLFNIASIRDRVHVNFGDIRQHNVLHYLVANQDYIFHLAGQNDHVLSQRDPLPDIEINIKGSAMLLEACRRYNPSVKIIYTGTRGEYGSSVTLPVNEDAPVNPKGIYELSSLTAQKLFGIYHTNHGLRSITLRLTNIYGPRAQMQHHRFGVVNWFVRQAIDGQTIRVFGDGTIKRYFLYVDDAVDAILRAAQTDAAYGQTFNVGRDTPNTFYEVAKLCVELAGRGCWEFAPFSAERAAQEPGDFYSDISKIRSIVGWEPKIDLREGLCRTIAFYKDNKTQYWQDDDGC